MDSRKLSRLVYIAAKLRERTPRIPRRLRRYVDNIEIIEAATSGTYGAAAELDVSVDQIKKLYRRGRKEGTADPGEFRSIVGREVINHDGLEDLGLKKRMSIIAEIDNFVSAADDSMVSLEEIALSSSLEVSDIKRWASGFPPIDIAFGGLYKGLMIIAAKPGVGKTSTMLAMAECMKREHPKLNIVFFEEEFPQNLAMARMKPIFARGNPFTDDDLLVTGGTSIEEIMDRLKERDKKMREHRVVFIDSPDTMPGLGAENRRFELGHIYRQAVKIKEQKATELVVVGSQLNRKKGGVNLDRLAESSDKSWLADMVVAITKAGYNRMKMKVIKNRFGIPDQSVIYHFDMAELHSEDALLEDIDDWED